MRIFNDPRSLLWADEVGRGKASARVGEREAGLLQPGRAAGIGREAPAQGDDGAVDGIERGLDDKGGRGRGEEDLLGGLAGV